MKILIDTDALIALAKEDDSKSQTSSFTSSNCK